MHFLTYKPDLNDVTSFEAYPSLISLYSRLCDIGEVDVEKICTAFNLWDDMTKGLNYGTVPHTTHTDRHGVDSNVATT